MIISKGNYINGQWRLTKGNRLESFNPANGTLLWQGAHATQEDIFYAFDTAKKSTAHWSFLNFNERCNIIKKFGCEIEKRKEELATLISLETGKPLWESHTEVSAVLGKIDLSIQAYRERTWPKELPNKEAKAYLRYKPHGVVVVLGAFNFPAHLSNGHIVPALLAGNTILYKPSDQCPAVAELIMECWHQSGIPAGVINCLQGDASCGKWLLEEKIHGVYFTGSYATGLRIHQQFSQRPEVILALEMGGNNPLVIDEVRDIDAAVYQTLLSTFITSGQRCTCARRVLIPSSTFGDEYLRRLLNATKNIKMASFDTNPEPFMGPVISYQHALMHLQAQKKLVDLGGTLLLNMALLKEKTGLLSPGIIDMTSVSDAPDEEIFAPLIQLYRYNQFHEAIKLANQTKYGLSAALFSDDPNQYHQFFQEVEAGLINWNRPTTGASSNLPFGGTGCSGNHRPSAYFAADYCAYPIASMEQPILSKPKHLLPGISLR